MMMMKGRMISFDVIQVWGVEVLYMMRIWGKILRMTMGIPVMIHECLVVNFSYHQHPEKSCYLDDDYYSHQHKQRTELMFQGHTGRTK